MKSYNPSISKSVGIWNFGMLNKWKAKSKTLFRCISKLPCAFFFKKTRVLVENFICKKMKFSRERIFKRIISHEHSFCQTQLHAKDNTQMAYSGSTLFTHFQGILRLILFHFLILNWAAEFHNFINQLIYLMTPAALAPQLETWLINLEGKCLQKQY